MKLIQDLRAGGCAVDYSLTPSKPDKQFKRALESKAARTVKLERVEGGELRVRIRSLRARDEKVLKVEEAVAFLCKKEQAA